MERMAEVKVLFICTGNTCRSPMAEGLFRAAVAKRGLKYEVSSAGIAAMDGTPMSGHTATLLAEREAEVEEFASRMVDEEMLAEATHVFCMTRGHLEALEVMFPEFEEKLFLATEFVEIDGVVGRDVGDPIGGGVRIYAEVADELEAAIEGILGFLAVKQ
ncbi:MAG: low molecular weight protein arginine phosphatase [Verrucomicrobiota bacterium]